LRQHRQRSASLAENPIISVCYVLTVDPKLVSALRQRLRQPLRLRGQTSDLLTMMLTIVHAAASALTL